MIRHYLSLFVFAAALLAGIQFPGFVDQYGKALQAHWEESERSVKEFREDAERFFKGDIDQLIAHYEKNQDPIIHKGGQNIQNLVARNRLLTKALNRFHENMFFAYSETFVSPVADIRSEVWASYHFMVQLNRFSVVFGLIFAVVAMFLTNGFLGGIKRILGSFFRKKQNAPEQSA